jgi:hypothetical protein
MGPGSAPVHSVDEKRGDDYKDGVEGPREEQDATLPPVPQRTGLSRIYALPIVQIAMVGFTCFLCPGSVLCAIWVKYSS